MPAPDEAAAAADAPGVTPAEIQRMFDSYALIQAQDQLKISDEKFPQFLTRFKALQDTRRRNMTGALPHGAGAAPAARTTRSRTRRRCKDRLKALDDLDARAQTDVAKAYDAINQVLDVRQQAQVPGVRREHGKPQAGAGDARAPGEPPEAVVP